VVVLAADLVVLINLCVVFCGGSPPSLLFSPWEGRRLFSFGVVGGF
jgi:hypothetical protein